MSNSVFSRLLVAACAAVVIACGGGAGTDSMVAVDETSTFGLVQSKVLANNCTNCHTSGSSFATESGLVLDPSVAYKNLVSVASHDATAQADGMLRVTPGNADKSLLYQKLILWDPNHTRNYGAPMPLGGESLSSGQIQFVKAWINAGAPQTGQVADAGLLQNLSKPVYSPFTPLAVPLNGYQVKVGPFDVAPRFERELFVRRDLRNPAPIYVSRFETKMRPNSHHLLLYTFTPNIPSVVMPAPDVIRDIRRPDGSMDFIAMLPMGYHAFVAGSMTPTGGYQFPQGIALELPANTTFDLNSHYVNTTGGSLTGEVFANLHTVDKSAVSKIAHTLFFNNESFTLPPKQITTVTKTFTMASTTTILMLTSHMHKHGQSFVVKIAGGPRNGEVVYQTTEWADPTIKIFDQPLVLQAGQGLTSVVTYNNTTSSAISFGLTSEDEMNIIYGYYY